MKKQDKKDKKDKKEKVLVADDGFHFVNFKFNLGFRKKNENKVQVEYKNMLVVIDWINNGQITKLNLGGLLQNDVDDEQTNQSLMFEANKTHEFGAVKVDENYLKLLTQNSFYVYLVNQENNELIEKMVMNYSDLLLIGDHNRLEKLEEDQEFIYQKNYRVSNVKLELEEIELLVETDNTLISVENMQKYNPLIIDIVKLTNIPKKIFKNIEPVFLELEFYEFYSIRTQQYSHRKDIDFNLLHVFLLELVEKEKRDHLIRSIQEKELFLKVYDKNYVSDQVYNEQKNFDFGEYRQKVYEQEQLLIQQQQNQDKDKNKKNEKKVEQKNEKKNDKKNDKKDVLQNIDIKESEACYEVQVDCYGEARFNCKGILKKNSNNQKFKLNIQPVVKRKQFGDDRKLDLQSIKDNQKMSNKYEGMGQYFENDTQVKLKIYFMFKQTQFYIKNEVMATKETEQQLDQDFDGVPGQDGLQQLKDSMIDKLDKEKLATKEKNDDKAKKNQKNQKDQKNYEQNDQQHDLQNQQQTIKPYERMIIVLPYEDFEMFQKIEDYIIDVNLKCLKKLKHKLEMKQQYLIMYELSESEKKDHSLNYINGIQIMDSKIRVYFLEGLQETNVFEELEKMVPHHTINEQYKYLRNRKVVFSERIYQFNLSIKRIKLFKSVQQILLKADYYQRSQFVQEFKNIFSALKVILESENLKYVSDNEHFPVVKDVLKMEKYLSKKLQRKDLYGQTFEEKPELMNKESLMIDNSDGLAISQIFDDYEQQFKESQIFTKSTIQGEYMNSSVENDQSVYNSLILPLIDKPDIYGRKSKTNTNRENSTNIKIEKYNDQDGAVYMYGGQKLNNYQLQLQRLRKQSDRDLDHHYTFSGDYLSQSVSKDVHESRVEQYQHSISLMKGGEFRIGQRSQAEKNKIFKQLEIDNTPYHIAKKESQMYLQRYDNKHIGDREWDIYFGKKQKYVYKRQKNDNYKDNSDHKFREEGTYKMKEIQTYNVNQSQNQVLDRY